MNDLKKTLAFAGVALVIALAAIFLRPEPFEPVRQKAGERLFAELEDPTVADALQIVAFDADRSTSERLKIERDGDKWVIASHNNYPADASGAKDRIQEVALKLIDLEIVDVASDQPEDHGLYGVVEPPEEGDVQEADDDDIGLLVGLEDDHGNKLAELIIGKQLRDEQSTEVKRFVRKAGEPTVYTAAIDTDQFKTKFSDWIDSDPLDINGADVRRLMIKDQNARIVEAQGPGGQTQQIVAIDPRFEMTINWNSDDSKWQFVDMLQRRGNRLVPSQLTEGEELNAGKLDELKRAVDNLKIVDVESKPKELIDGVKSDEDLVNDPRIEPLLTKKGFYPARDELLSSEGEIRVQTDDAIEYILRFGREAGVEVDDENKSKLTRYMLVSAAVAEDQLKPKPKVDDAPMTGDPPGPGPIVPPLGAGGQDGDEGEPGTAADAAEAPATADDGADSGEAASGEDESTAGEEGAEDSEPTEEDDPMPPDTIPPVGEGEADSSEEDELARKRKAAEEKVAELNKKFAPWFYVISEDEYKKIRLRRFDVIKEKDGSSFGLDELKDLDELPRGDGDELPNIDSP